jgi:hypothetical protein
MIGDLGPPPPPPPLSLATCLSFSVFLQYVSPVMLTADRGVVGMGEETNHTTARKSGPLYSILSVRCQKYSVPSNNTIIRAKKSVLVVTLIFACVKTVVKSNKI